MAKFKIINVKGQRKIIGWATSKNGKHYPIFEDYKKGKSYTEEEQVKKQNTTISDEEMQKRVVDNMIVSHYGNEVAYRDKKNNLWTTSRDNYNKYARGESDKLGGILANNDEDALKTMIFGVAESKYPYNGYVADEKSGNGKKRDEFINSEFERLKGSIYDSSTTRKEKVKTNENFAKYYNADGTSKELFGDKSRTPGYENEDRSYAGWELYSDDPNRYKKSNDEAPKKNKVVSSTSASEAFGEDHKLSKRDVINFKMGGGLSKDAVKAYATLNDKAEENTDRPVAKKLASQQQGRSNRKEVKNKIQQHILEHFTEDYGYEGNQEDAFVKQMEAMGESNIWNAGKRFAEGGSLLVYTGDMRNFLDDLKINPKGKKFSDEKVFETYTNLVGRETQDLYNTIQKKKAMGKSKNKVVSANDTGSKLLKMVKSIKGGKLNQDEYDNDTYSIGEYGNGYYVQFQDRTSQFHDNVMKYQHTSPRVSTRTWARVWKDGENVYNNSYDKDAKITSKYGARKAVADYLENVALLNTNQLVKSYMDRGYSRETAEKMAKEAIKHRLKKRK